MIRGCYPSATVLGIDRDPEIAARAVTAGHISAGFGMERFSRVLQEAGLVLVATPVNATLELLPLLDHGCRSGAIIVDVGASKRLICDRAAHQPHIAASELFFIGGNVVSSTLRSGIESVRPSRLRDAPFLLCPSERVPEQVVRMVEAFLIELSFQPLRLTAQLHDELLALTSHAPRLISAALASCVGRRANQGDRGAQLLYKLCGRGFELTTAEAAAAVDTWASALTANAELTAATLRALAAELDHYAQALMSGEIAHALNDAARYRVAYERANARHATSSIRA
jgi:prephenate dehydrogenase